MSTTPRKPPNYWAPKYPAIKLDAKTMTVAELAKKYGASKSSMQSTLKRIGATAVLRNYVWSEQKEELAQLYKTVGVTKMSRHYGVSCATIYGALRRQGIETKTASRVAEGVASVADLAHTMTLNELGEHLGLSPQTVRKQAKSLGIRPKRAAPPKIWAERMDDVMQMLTDGKSCNEVAEHYGTRPVSVRKALARFGLKMPRRPKKPPTPRVTVVKRSVQKAKTYLVQTKPYIVRPRVTAGIIYPENFVYTKVESSYYEGIRICNGTSTAIYDPSKHEHTGHYTRI